MASATGNIRDYIMALSQMLHAPFARCRVPRGVCAGPVGRMGTSVVDCLPSQESPRELPGTWVRRLELRLGLHKRPGTCAYSAVNCARYSALADADKWMSLAGNESNLGNLAHRTERYSMFKVSRMTLTTTG
jgi:hypothetical protein